MGGLLVPAGVWRNPLAVLLPEGALSQDCQQGHFSIFWWRCHCPHHDRSLALAICEMQDPGWSILGPSVLMGAIAKNADWKAAGYLCGAPSDECNVEDVGYPDCTDHTPTKVTF